MSFILDALKKADEARHPTASSSLGKIRVPRLTPRHARWPWVVGGAALLAVNAGVIAYVMWPKAVSVTAPARDSRPATAAGSPVASARPPEASLPGRPPGPVAAVPPAEPPRAAPVAPVRAAESIAPAEPVKPIERAPVPTEPTKRIERSPVPTHPDVRGTLAAPPPTRVTPPPASPSSQAPTRQPPVPPASSSAASGAPPTVATMPPPGAAASPRQPSVEPPRAEPTRPAVTTPAPATPAGGGDEISKLKLTVHVWADKPAERLVFINGRKYVQGDRIEDKVLLEEITPEGAAVSYQGRRSLLRP